MKLIPFSIVILASFFTGCRSYFYEDSIGRVEDNAKFQFNLPADLDFRFNEDFDEIETEVKKLLAKGLTSEIAIHIGLINNPGLKSAYENLGIYKADVMEAGLLHNPTVEIEVSESFEDEELRGQMIDPRDFQYHFTVLFDIADFLLKPKRKQLSKKKLELVRMRLTKEISELVHEILDAVTLFQGESRKKELFLEIFESVQVGVELAQAQYEAGNINDLQLSQYLSVYQDFKLELASQNMEIAYAREKINRLLGIWGKDTNWKTSQNLPDLPPKLLDLESIAASAIVNSFELAEANFEISILQEKISIQRASVVPSLDIGYLRKEEDLEPPISGGIVEFDLPIFDRNQGEIAKLKAMIRKKEMEILEKTISLRSNIRLSTKRYTDVRERVQYYKNEILPLKERVTDLSQRHYNAMFMGAYALLDVKRNELETRFQYVESLVEYWKVHSGLDHAGVGGHIENGEMGKSKVHTMSDKGSGHD